MRHTSYGARWRWLDRHRLRREGRCWSVISHRLRIGPERIQGGMKRSTTSIGHAKMMKDSIGIDISKAHLDVHRLSTGDAAQSADRTMGIRALRRWIGAGGPRPRGLRDDRRPSRRIRALQRVTVSETCMGRTRYTEFLTLPGLIADCFTPARVQPCAIVPPQTSPLPPAPIPPRRPHLPSPRITSGDSSFVIHPPGQG